MGNVIFPALFAARNACTTSVFELRSNSLFVASIAFSHPWVILSAVANRTSLGAVSVDAGAVLAPSGLHVGTSR